MKKLIRKILWMLGYDIQNIYSSGGSLLLTSQLIKRTRPTVVLDVGANEGQFATQFLDTFPGYKILSFEPLSKAHAIATEKSTKRTGWTVFRRTAIGNEKGDVRINIANNSVSSSLYPMQTLHSDSAPDSVIVGSETTTVERLDDILPITVERERYYLKIDTQGFELNVLKGATKIFDQVVAIQAELSFGELYAGQAQALEVIEWLSNNGFYPYGFSHVFRDSKNGRLLQMDGFFLRA